MKLPPEATVVVFEPTIAPLRVPLPANQDDDPSSKGPFILAFKDEDAWLRAWQDCEVKVSRECEVIAFLPMSREKQMSYKEKRSSILRATKFSSMEALNDIRLGI